MSTPSPIPTTPTANGSAETFLARFTGHPAQAAFIACRERFSFYVGGVGAGKTTAGAVRAIYQALAQPGSLGVVGAPTYPMLRDATERTVFDWLDGELGDDPRADEPGVVAKPRN